MEKVGLPRKKDSKKTKFWVFRVLAQIDGFWGFLGVFLCFSCGHKGPYNGEKDVFLAKSPQFPQDFQPFLLFGRFDGFVFFSLNILIFTIHASSISNIMNSLVR